MQWRAYAHWANWIIRKAHSRPKTCQNRSWGKYMRPWICCPRPRPTQTHTEHTFHMTFLFPYANQAAGFCSCSGRLCTPPPPLHLTHPPPPPISCEPVELWHPHTSTRSLWHRALWWDAPWPALIHGRESKWRGSKIDRSKDSPSELKANRHLAFQSCSCSLWLLRSTLYKIYMTHQKGHKSLFDCGTVSEKYISRHLFWRKGWKT